MGNEALEKITEILHRVKHLEEDVQRFTERHVGRKELAEMWNVDEETISNYHKFHNLPKLKNGKYPLRKCIDWVYDSPIAKTQTGISIINIIERPSRK